MFLRVEIVDRRTEQPSSDVPLTDVTAISDPREPTAPYVLLHRAEHNDLLVNLDYYQLTVNYASC